MEPAAVASLAGSAGIVVGSALTVAAGGARGPLLALGLALLAMPLAVASPLGALPSAFWIVAVLTASFLLFGGGPRSRAAVAPLPLGGWPEAGFIVLGAAMAFAAGRATLGPAEAGAAMAATAAAVAAAVLLVFGTGICRAAAGAMLALLAAPLAISALGVAVEGGLTVALALAVLAVAAAARGLAEGDGSPTRPGADA